MVVFFHLGHTQLIWGLRLLRLQSFGYTVEFTGGLCVALAAALEKELEARYPLKVEGKSVEQLKEEMIRDQWLASLIFTGSLALGSFLQPPANLFCHLGLGFATGGLVAIGVSKLGEKI